MTTILEADVFSDIESTLAQGTTYFILNILELFLQKPFKGRLQNTSEALYSGTISISVNTSGRIFLFWKIQQELCKISRELTVTGCPGMFIHDLPPRAFVAYINDLKIPVLV